MGDLGQADLLGEVHARQHACGCFVGPVHAVQLAGLGERDIASSGIADEDGCSYQVVALDDLLGAQVA